MHELNIFIIFFVSGIAFALIFFVAASLTGKIKKRKLQIFLESVLLIFYLSAIFTFFLFFILKINMGVIRFYMPIAMMLGFIICQKTLVKTFALLFNKVYNINNGRKRKKSSNS